MKVELGTAIIGAGSMGKNHARVYFESSTLLAVCDSVPERGEEVACKFKAKYFSDYRKMLDEIQPDAVSVVVPTELHKEVSLECLFRKIPVLVEKPMAVSFSQTVEMLNIAQKQKVFLMVGHVERFNPAVLKLKEVIVSGRLGKIINLSATRVGISPPRVPNSDVALDLAIHDVDVFNFLLDRFPDQKKICRTRLFKDNIADSTTILLVYGEITGVIVSNWITPFKKRQLIVTGTEGLVELDYIEQKLTLYSRSGEQNGNGNPKDISIVREEPLKTELEYFLSHCKRKNPDYSIALASAECVKLLEKDD